MKICFSTLGCPDWGLGQAIQMAVTSGYQGIELRFLEGEDSLWKLPVFQGEKLADARRMIADRGLYIACVGTSCRFHFRDPQECRRWVDEGRRMAELAAALGSPGIRVFGDKIQPDEERDSTRGWIADGIRRLAEEIKDSAVEVWLETHGDFASSAETMQILGQSGDPQVGVVWDPANALSDGGEPPIGVVRLFGSSLRHVHLRDLDCPEGKWEPVLTGEGKLPLSEIVTELRKTNYPAFISFEWEKKWRPALAGPEIAIPQFAEWFRQIQ
jgi:sugar phosphate isomerase/epimerase